MTAFKLTAVLVSFNSGRDLAQVLPGLADPRIEVIVVDNCSSDDSREVAGQYAHVTVVPLESNTGWTAANNVGAKSASGRLLAFVNPDARPTASQLLELADRLGPGIASVTPRFIEADGTTSAFYFREARPLSGLLTFTSAGRRLDSLLGGRAMSARLYGRRPEAHGKPDQPGAACLVVNRADFLAKGGFDESMWLFFSDAAWCAARAREGQRHLVAWDVPVRHIGGTSMTDHPTATIQRLFQRDYFAYARGYYGLWGQLVTALGLVLLAVLVPAISAAVRLRTTVLKQRLALFGDMVHVARGHRSGPLP